MNAAHAVYSQRYVNFYNGQVPGYWVFPSGMAENWVRISPQASPDAKTIYQKMLANAAFSNASAYNDNYQGGCGAWYAIRETSYGLLNHLKAASFGLAVNTARVNQLKSYLFLALDQTWSGASSCSAGGEPFYRKPFMSALAAQALIAKWDAGDHDAAIITKLANAGDVMWSTMLYTNPPSYPTCQATFQYTDYAPQGTEPTPDLNLLINPFFYWLYCETGDSKWLTRADALTDCGVRLHLNINSGKQYNQSYRWSRLGFAWRAGICNH